MAAASLTKLMNPRLSHNPTSQVSPCASPCSAFLLAAAFLLCALPDCLTPCLGQTTTQEWQARAVLKYPDLGVSNSAFNQRFVAAAAARRQTKPGFFADPRWPLLLADELAPKPAAPPTPALSAATRAPLAATTQSLAAAGLAIRSPAPPTPTGAITPLDAPLEEENETLVTCELTHAPGPGETRIFASPADADTAKGIWHYKLWLPKGYLADAFKKWPCMFIMSPSGNASMGAMADHLKAKGYVVVMLIESKNGPWGPVMGDFLAAHDDVIKRLRIEEGKKFATGQSGGARGSSLFVQARPGFGGVILQSAGAASVNGVYDVQGMQRNGKLNVAMTMGNADNNNKNEVDRMKAALNSPARFADFEFPGGHVWAPKEVFEQAITWVEQKNGM